MSGLAHRVIGSAGATLDRALLTAAKLAGVGPRGARGGSGADERARLEDLAAAYAEPAVRGALFAPPPAAMPSLRGVSDAPSPDGVAVLDAAWRSAYVAALPAERERHGAHPGNRVAHARLFLSQRPRPAVILVHGYNTGRFALEERVWPVAWLRRIGLDVALIVLPFHGPRARGNATRLPPFPGPDAALTNEAFGQAVHDVRALARWLRARGAPSVGLMGMSLGGYTAALTATVEPDLAFVVPITPLASLADFAREQGALPRAANDPDGAAAHRALDAAHRAVSPFARASLLAPGRALVVAAEADQITPLPHAALLARHLGARVVRFPGSHVVHVGIAEGYRAVAAMLRDHGIIAPAALPA